MDFSKPVVIIGGGLTGSLMATMLGAMGLNVDLYEKRNDLRNQSETAGRSINLALSPRGLKALDRVALVKEIKPLLIPLRGRLIHDVSGEIKLQPYGKDDSQVINSVSRLELNKILLNAADALDQVNLYFNHECRGYDNRTNTLYMEDDAGEEYTLSPAHIIAADGANSAIRTSMLKMGRFDYSQHYMTYGYKELMIPPDDSGEYQLGSHGLHIWPRDRIVMIALPNPDRSFTLTLFAPFEGENGFDELISDQQIISYFEKFFPDAVDKMPTLLDDVRQNPTGRLVTIKCEPWTKGNAVLIGDSAHAIIPFYGQGMNAGFEDCRVLIELIEQNKDSSWHDICQQFSEVRKPHADAIADLSYDNFIEMRDGVADPDFLVKKDIEIRLYDQFDDIISKYAMVTFSPDLGYAIAKKKGEILETTIREYYDQHGDPSEEELIELHDMIIQRYNQLT